jgi:hypothetical protein
MKTFRMKTFRWLFFGLVIAGCTSPSTSTTPIAQAPSPAAAQLPSPVWEVNWRICDVVNPRQIRERGCLPDMNAVDRPDRPAHKVVFWADNIQSPEDIHIETTNSFMDGVESHLFVRSKGCINSPPGAEDFYFTGVKAIGVADSRYESMARTLEDAFKISQNHTVIQQPQAILSTRTVDPPLPEAQWTVTAQQLTPEEAAQLVQSVQSPISGRRFRTMGTTGACLTLAQWKER